MNAVYDKKLADPMVVREMYPLTENEKEIVGRRDNEIKKILDGEDGRLLLIIGPCSADNEDSVTEYISRLCPLQEKVKDKIYIVPRIYTNKPRTNGEGYKGLLHQPVPTQKADVFNGLIATRKMHLRALRETGFSCADEMLYPENYTYLEDLLAYVAVGARSVENQQHRLTASAVSSPVGMKNPTSGDLNVMMNAVYTARHSHTFIYRDWQVHSAGNPYSHAILRGYTDKHGQMMPNYHYEDLRRLREEYDRRQLGSPSVIIDTNHCNSGKDPFEQPRIISEVLDCCRYSGDIASMVKGFMVESYIEDGAQKAGEGCCGRSITDPCLGWEKTERMILDTADRL